MASDPKDPFDPKQMTSLKHWGSRPVGEEVDAMADEVVVDCGWGRLIFGQTFQASDRLAAALKGEADGRRDIALYIRDPHVVLSFAPQELFLDPSLTYRLTPSNYRRPAKPLPGIELRKARLPQEVEDINRIFLSRNMVPCHEGFEANRSDKDPVKVLVAEAVEGGEILGVATGVDHHLAFGDPDGGSSLWALAVDPQAMMPGIGEHLVRALAEGFFAAGRAFMDLSVKHDNRQAIALYRKLGFEQVPVYCLKRKNSINEPLFIGPSPEESLNVYARIIVSEARRRGIFVEINDADAGFFTLTLGGRSVACRESLSELTSAVAMSRCDDKAVTRRILARAGLRTPEQMVVERAEDAVGFLQRHGRVVVKPSRGEQGMGVSVDLGTMDEVAKAFAAAARISERVLVEEFVAGEDLRVIVIDDHVVAAAVRRPPRVLGDGRTSIGDLIAKQSRRREAATDGESRIPMDDETRRTVKAAGHEMDDILAEGVSLAVRGAANLHTGGTIHDVTAKIHQRIAEAAVQGARAIGIPVVGLDFLVTDVSGPDYVIIEANERPGLANHEPQPTVERFVDLLFPQSRQVPT